MTEITQFPDRFPFSQSFPVQTFPAFHPRIVVLVKNERIYDQKYWYIFWIVVIRVSLFSLDVLRFNSFNFMKSTMFVPDWNKSWQKSRLHEESGPKSPSLVWKVETAHNKWCRQRNAPRLSVKELQIVDFLVFSRNRISSHFPRDFPEIFEDWGGGYITDSWFWFAGFILE